MKWLHIKKLNRKPLKNFFFITASILFFALFISGANNYPENQKIKKAHAQETISVTYYCGGSVECVPSPTITQPLSNTNITYPITTTTTTPNPTTSVSSTTVPTTTSSTISIDTNNEKQNKKKKRCRRGDNSDAKGLLNILLELLEQIIQLLIQFISGGDITNLNLNSPQTTPTNHPTTTNPTSSLNPTTSTSNPITSVSTNPTTTQPVPSTSAPASACTQPIPAEGQLADASNPTTVVGDGTAASCTYDVLNSAIQTGGVITFNCGASPVTIPITSTLNLSTSANTVIDGGNLITLDGQGAVQILNFNSSNWMTSDTRVTIQNITLANAKMSGTEAIPPAPAPCSQGFNDGKGGAIYIRDGNLSVINSTFTNNQAEQLGPDTGGGAIYITGSKNGATIVGSTFTGNSGSNAGAVGALFANLSIYNSQFTSNRATGNGANSNDATLCPNNINVGQNQVGSGGNGGAIYQDGGSSTNVYLCGVDVQNNSAGEGANGSGVFMTSNDWTGTLSVIDSTIINNTGGSPWTTVQDGSVISFGSAFGTNTGHGIITNSTLQGL